VDLQPLNHIRPEDETDDESRDGGINAPEGDVPEDIEDAEMGMKGVKEMI
jgi:hypothetical protein